MEHGLSQEAPSRVTVLLQAAAAGDTQASEALFPVVYDELRRIAGALMSRERAGHTLQPTALVHEAYVRLVGAETTWQNKAHFFGAAARAMRHILIDRARHVKATRVKAGAIEHEDMLPTIDSTAPGGVSDAAGDLLLLDTSMESLRQRDERQHEVVMLRFFAGLTIEQTALAMGLSTGTVKNEWTYARAWLLREMERARGN
jgi:RNA polymerase sigma factor (TIGR02999 family)